MKNTDYILLLSALAIIFLAQRLEAQSKYVYIVAADSAIAELSAYKQSTGFYDIERLKAINEPDLDDNSERFQDLKHLLDDIKSVSIRKFIRHLPDGIKTLHTRRETEESVEHLQRQYIIEVHSPITEQQKIQLLTKYKRIQEIEKDPIIEVNTWPPNDPYYSSQSQFYSTSYNINLPRAWDFTAGNSGIKVAIVDHGVDYNHPDLGNGIGAGYRVRGGWDWKDNDPYPLPTYSTETHATPIAGMIGAINWNNTGVIGMAGGSSSAVESGCQLSRATSFPTAGVS